MAKKILSTYQLKAIALVAEGCAHEIREAYRQTILDGLEEVSFTREQDDAAYDELVKKTNEALGLKMKGGL